jgi:hypothetical protein
MGAIPSTGSGRSFYFSQELAPGWDFELADIGYNLAGIIAALGLIWLIERASGGEWRIGTLRSRS